MFLSGYLIPNFNKMWHSLKKLNDVTEKHSVSTWQFLFQTMYMDARMLATTMKHNFHPFGFPCKGC